MDLTFEITVDVPDDKQDWNPYVRQQILGTHNSFFQVKSAVPLSLPPKEWFENIEQQEISKGKL